MSLDYSAMLMRGRALPMGQICCPHATSCAPLGRLITLTNTYYKRAPCAFRASVARGLYVLAGFADAARPRRPLSSWVFGRGVFAKYASLSLSTVMRIQRQLRHDTGGPRAARVLFFLSFERGHARHHRPKSRRKGTAEGARDPPLPVATTINIGVSSANWHSRSPSGACRS